MDLKNPIKVPTVRIIKASKLHKKIIDLLESIPTGVITKEEFSKLPRYDYDIDEDNIFYEKYFDSKDKYIYCKFSTYEGLCKQGTTRELIFGRQILSSSFYDGEF